MRTFLRYLLLLVPVFIAGTVKPQTAVHPGDVIAMLRPGVEATTLAHDIAAKAGVHAVVRVEGEVSAPMRAWLFRFDPAAASPDAVLRAFRAHAGVEMAQFNHVVKPREVPDDPLYGQQWHHQNIDSEGAWDITTGGVTALGDTIVVAIIEKADLPHPDLAANTWINRQEIADNGVDDDENGYVDDVRGWNPATGNDDVYGGPHGTEVAGMIGAVGNNGQQMVGANWHVKMMPVHYASTLESDVLASYTYPLVMRRLYNQTGGTKGAFVVATNASWGVDGGQPADAPIWCAMYDTLGTAGVLSCGATANNNVNIDVVGDLPTACPSEYLIAVTATNSSDMRTFSGYGATTIDVGAPGANVFTTTLGGGTGSTSGTSFASPLTAGVLALMYSVPCTGLAALAHGAPEVAAQQVRDALFAGVEQVGNLPGQTVTGGRINAHNSVQLLMDSCSACPVPWGLSATSDAIGSATLHWNALPGSYTVRYRPQAASVWTVLEGLSDQSLPISDLAVCAAYEFQVSADCDTADSGFGPVFTWTSEGCCTAPLSITATADDSTTATVAWTNVLASSAYDLRYRVIGTTEWTVLSGLSGSSIPLEGLPSCHDLEVQMRSQCGVDTASWSASVPLHTPGCGQCVEGTFCTQQGDATYEWIAHVGIGQIDRTSGSDGGYADPGTTLQSTQLSIGDTVTIELAPGFSGTTYMEHFTVWLDLDRDGQFTAAEAVYDAPDNVNTAISGLLIVPEDATAGPARLRVGMRYNGAAINGCTSFDYGEVEDYCVTLVEGPVSVAERPAPMAVQVYPQPAADRVHFVLGHPAPAVLEVRDASGRMLQQQAFQGGRCTVSVDRLAEGLYLWQVRTPAGAVSSGVFVVAR
jgi:serine protease